jgi:hypothetical protein
VLAVASRQLALSHVVRMPVKRPYSHTDGLDPRSGMITLGGLRSLADGSSIWSEPEFEHGHSGHTGQTRIKEQSVTAITVASNLKVYFDFHDWWIGYYKGESHHYVCVIPTFVIRWVRLCAVNRDAGVNAALKHRAARITITPCPELQPGRATAFCADTPTQT